MEKVVEGLLRSMVPVSRPGRAHRSMVPLSAGRRSGSLRQHHHVAMAALACLLGLPGCDGCADPEVPPVVCASSPLDVDMRLDPCDSAEVLAGPIRVDRGRGTPDTTRLDFEAPTNGTYCLLVRNGSHPRDRVTAGWIRLDGADVVRPDRFLRHESSLAIRGQLLAGPHALEMRVASAPGSSVDIELRFVGTPDEEEIGAARALAELDYQLCRETNATLRLLGGAEAEQRLGQARRLGITPGQMRVRLSAHRIPRYASPLPRDEVADPEDWTVEQRAAAWLDRHRDLLRWTDDRSALRHVGTTNDITGAATVRFDQWVEGVRVDGARLEVRLDGNGVVRGFSGIFVPDPPDSLVPSISAEAAVRWAALALGEDLTAASVGAPRLVILDASGRTGWPTTRLAWRIQMVRGETRAPTWAWVDAENGDLLWSTPALFNADGEGRGMILYHSDDFVPQPPWYATQIWPELPGSPGPCWTFHRDADGDGRWEEVWGCRALRDDIEIPIIALEADWSVRFHREGWSGDGVPPRADLPDDPGIPAGDAYRVLYDNARAWGYRGWGAMFAPPPYLDLLDREPYLGYVPASGDRIPGRSVLLSSAFLSADVIRHEFGHGFHLSQVDWLFAGDTTSPMFEPVSEHIADFWALGAGDLDFVMEAPLDPDDSCDDYIRAFDGTGCPPGCSSCPPACGEFSHLSWLDEVWNSACYDAPELSKSPHRNGCILSKLAYLLMRSGDDDLVWHGVSTRPLGWDLGRALFDKYFEWKLGGDDDFHDYAAGVRLTLAWLDEKCPELAPGEEPVPPCTGDEAREDRASDAVDAMGFWSDSRDLTSALDLGGPVLRPRSGPAVVAAGGLIWVFFVGWVQVAPDRPGSLLGVYGIQMTDPLNVREHPRAAILTAGVDVDVEATNAPSATVHADEIWVAYVPQPRGPVRVLRGPVGPDEGFPGPPDIEPFLGTGETAESPALVGAFGQLFLAFVDAGTKRLRYTTFTPPGSAPPAQDFGPVPECSGPGAQPPAETAPAFLRWGSGTSERLILAFVADHRPRPGLCDARFLAARQWDAGAERWTAEEWPASVGRCRWATDPSARGPTHVESSVVVFRPAAGSSLAYFQDRIQVAFAGAGPHSDGPYPHALRQVSFGATLAGDETAFAPDSGTRIVPLAAESGARPALLSWEHPDLGPLLLMFWISSDDPDGPRLRVAWRRSYS